MTTNARDEKWSSWIENMGYIPENLMGEPVSVKYRDGVINNGVQAGKEFDSGGSCPERNAGDWSIDGVSRDIIAYRYKIKEPESDIHPDLEKIAYNFSVWPKWAEKVQYLPDDPNGSEARLHFVEAGSPIYSSRPFFFEGDVKAARQQLGLDSSGIAEPDEEECLQLAYERMGDESVKVSVAELRKQSKSDGMKYDSDKPAMDLIPPYMEEEVGMVLAFGAQKYAPGNWRKVSPLRSRYLAAAQRHINALKKGEQMDPESGLHHAAHAVCCLMFLGEVELEPLK